MAQEDGKEITVLRRIDNFGRAVANGATFGLADVIAGTLNAKLLNTTSCSSALLCIDEEIRHSNRAARETPLIAKTGLVVGAMLTPGSILSCKNYLGGKVATPLSEDMLTQTALSLWVNIYLKGEISSGKIVVHPDVHESEITAPSVPNLLKEITGQKAPSSPRR